MNWYNHLKDLHGPSAVEGMYWKDQSLWKKNRPLCGAKTRVGGSCKAKAVVDKWGKPVNGRCRMHGGLSCGPRTEEGRQRSREAASRGMKAYWERIKSEEGSLN